MKIVKCQRCGKEFEVEKATGIKYCSDCLEKNKEEKRLKQKESELQKRQQILLNGIEGIDYVIDRWNGLATKTIGGKWMEFQHPGKSLEDYIKEFPDAPLVCKSTSEKISDNTSKSMNRPEMKKLFSEKVRGDKNPNSKCNTTEEQRKSVSPFSKSFKKYEGLSDKEKHQQITKYLKTNETDRTTNQIGYWIKKGYTEEEAKEKVSERQRTFTLEKCIEKYGQKEGYERWSQRQERWFKSVRNSFLIDGDNRTPISKFENDCKEIICQKLHMKLPKKQKYMSDQFGNHYSYDLTINHKIIEFNGDFWHMNPQIYNKDSYNKVKQKTALEIWNYDDAKIQCAIKNGYDVLVIWESEYNKNKEGVIQKCLDFLTKE